MSVQRGAESGRLDRVFAVDVPDDAGRAAIFDSAARILAHGPDPTGPDRVTGLALGYVQSGKTMSFTALTALAADNGYRLVVAFLGSIKMLLAQNTERLVTDLGIERNRYTWIHLDRPTLQKNPPSRVDDYLSRGKPVLVTVLKHAGHIAALAEIIEQSTWARDVRALIIDDEADQVSLNTKARQEEQSRTYEEIVRLRAALGRHLYVQYTATPFAPLLIDPQDALSPDFVEVLTPGPAYTGGETFFVSQRDTIVRLITEEEANDKRPNQVPEGLRRALGTFFAGAALIQANGVDVAPVSMLVHPSHLNVVQAGYHDLVQTLVDSWKQRLRRAPGDPGREADIDELVGCARDLAEHGVPMPPREELAQRLRDVVVDAEVWLVNSTADLQRIEWWRSPVHVLVGGNKLDRGFTVKGLTVTYMTRAAESSQADTVEQRARAFGYKRPYLEYCRFFAPPSVVDMFTALVHTEDDMRASLLEWTAAGYPLDEWAVEVGLVLPLRLRPTRSTVLRTNPTQFDGTGWHTLRHPDLDPGSRTHNAALVAGLGLADAPRTSFGALSHPHLADLDVGDTLLPLLDAWRVSGSPGWPHDRIEDFVGRAWRAGAVATFDLLLLEDRDGQPRRRGWSEPLGIPNLMQGHDLGTGYPGDRALLPDRVCLEVHRVGIPSQGVDEVYTLALHVPAAIAFPNIVTTKRTDPG